MAKTTSSPNVPGNASTSGMNPVVKRLQEEQEKKRLAQSNPGFGRWFAMLALLLLANFVVTIFYGSGSDSSTVGAHTSSSVSSTEKLHEALRRTAEISDVVGRVETLLQAQQSEVARMRGEVDNLMNTFGRATPAVPGELLQQLDRRIGEQADEIARVKESVEALRSAAKNSTPAEQAETTAFSSPISR